MRRATLFLSRLRCLRGARKKNIAVVKPRQHKSAERGFGGIFKQVVADRTDSVKF